MVYLDAHAFHDPKPFSTIIFSIDFLQIYQTVQKKKKKASENPLSVQRQETN